VASFDLIASSNSSSSNSLFSMNIQPPHTPPSTKNDKRLSIDNQNNNNNNDGFKDPSKQNIKKENNPAESNLISLSSFSSSPSVSIGKVNSSSINPNAILTKINNSSTIVDNQQSQTEEEDDDNNDEDDEDDDDNNDDDGDNRKRKNLETQVKRVSLSKMKHFISLHKKSSYTGSTLEQITKSMSQHYIDNDDYDADDDKIYLNLEFNDNNSSNNNNIKTINILAGKNSSANAIIFENTNVNNSYNIDASLKDDDDAIISAEKVFYF
jgi:hypothetical protein